MAACYRSTRRGRHTVPSASGTRGQRYHGNTGLARASSRTSWDLTKSQGQASTAGAAVFFLPDIKVHRTQLVGPGEQPSDFPLRWSGDATPWLGIRLVAVVHDGVMNRGALPTGSTEKSDAPPSASDLRRSGSAPAGAARRPENRSRRRTLHGRVQQSKCGSLANKHYAKSTSAERVSPDSCSKLEADILGPGGVPPNWVHKRGQARRRRRAVPPHAAPLAQWGQRGVKPTDAMAATLGISDRRKHRIVGELARAGWVRVCGKEPAPWLSGNSSSAAEP